jgi:flagellum-specific peptidoglycan hydrolase FlgJ
MKAQEFVNKFYPFAKQTQDKTGISAIFILAQAALESAWGNSAPGNMFFGVKDNDGLNGNEQLLLTTEYIDNPDKKFPAIISIVQVGKKLWKYRVRDWFRKYKTPEECFTDHANFFFKYKRYASALNVKQDPYAFAFEVAKAGYATDPNYAGSLHKVIGIITQYVK